MTRDGTSNDIIKTESTEVTNSSLKVEDERGRGWWHKHFTAGIPEAGAGGTL